MTLRRSLHPWAPERGWELNFSAGLLVETKKSTVLTAPWISGSGFAKRLRRIRIVLSVSAWPCDEAWRARNEAPHNRQSA